MEGFLSDCGKSGDSAYAAIRSVLERLENPSTRSDARVFLADLHKRFDSDESSADCFQRYHFRIHDVVFQNSDGYRQKKKLTLMEIPSIFVPEDWSFTFFEGINRHPDSFFKDKLVTELGCGNGWISIALADKWSPSKVYGLDINPRAIKIAQINLFLNALDENGQLIYDEEGKTLLDRVEFHESDLLSYCRDRNIELDRIVGCIPQILNPNPEAMSKMITEHASEEFLYSLSNYCALQGFVEDQFGLGLIARAVEEGISAIKPLGIMVFNIGGRPGQGVCKRLFERRGFQITKLWQTKITQASDTDISALVEIEKNSGHRFEFFMGLVGDQPICARTAWAYGKAEGSISHALSVFSCQLRQPHQVKIIFDFLKNGFQKISSSLDLSFDDESVADEKIPFLAYLASTLKSNIFFPYEPPGGSMRFRNLIAGFMRKYHHIPLDMDNVIVFPSRAVAIEDALHLFSPRLAIVDEHLTKHFPKQWITSLAIKGNADNSIPKNTVTVIEAPRQSDLMIELIKKLKPQVVITGMANFEAITSSAFEHLIIATGEIGCRLFVDISDHLELSSLPRSNGVLKYLAGHILPPHVAIICGLVKNQVYSDLEVAFIISEEQSIIKALSKSVELLEGNTALFSQYYYGCLIHELLSFQIAERKLSDKRGFVDEKFAKVIDFASSATHVLENAELSICDFKAPAVIHMDVDKSYLSVPSCVKASIFESFARQNIIESETDVRSGIQHLIESCYKFSTDNSSEFVYGDTPLALFKKLVLCCIQEEGTFLFPSGCNGNYMSAAKFLRANVVTIPTQYEDRFKFSGKKLAGALHKVKRPWVYLSGPTVIPSGVLYSNEEIQEIISVCHEAGARVVIDTSFSGLEFTTEGWNGWNLENILSKLQHADSSFCVSLIGGLSFGLLTGGLDFGFLILNQPQLIDAFYTFPGLNKPHGTVKYAVKKLLDEQKAHNLLEHDIIEQKCTLKNRFDRLTEKLKSCGWDVVKCHSGISLLAKPTAYLGKHIISKDYKVELSDNNIREAVFRATGLCINSGVWTGIPDYCRFTIALSDDDFEQALECIAQFKQLVLGS